MDASRRNPLDSTHVGSYSAEVSRLLVTSESHALSNNTMTTRSSIELEQREISREARSESIVTVRVARRYLRRRVRGTSSIEATGEEAPFLWKTSPASIVG